MTDTFSVLQRIIQRSHEIEQTYGDGKSYSFSTIRSSYSQSEWESKKQDDQRWLATAREWQKVRNPLIAEVQSLAALHRDAFRELADLVDKQAWKTASSPELAWAEIRRVALAAASRMKAETGSDELDGTNEGVDDLPVPGTDNPRSASRDGDRAAIVPVEQASIPKRPSDSAFQAWRLRDLTGMRTQKEIADKMSQELRRTVHQGEVSRWLKEVDEYRRAGGIFPDLPSLSSKPQTFDPAVLDLGERTDRRTPRQRARRRDDSHAE